MNLRKLTPLLCTALLSGLASAQSTITFTGVLTEVTQDDLSVFADLVPGSTTLFGSFDYDPLAPSFGEPDFLGLATFPALALEATAGEANYAGLSPLVQIEAGPDDCESVFGGAGVPQEIIDALCGGLDLEGALVASATLPAPSGFGGNGTLAVRLVPSADSTFPTDALPTPELLNLEALAQATVSVSFVQFDGGFQVSSAVYQLTDLSGTALGQLDGPGLGIQLGQVQAPSSAITLSMWNAAPSAPLAIFVTGVAGQSIAPLFSGIAASLDSSGTWISPTIPLPPSASGLQIELTGATFDAGGGFALTNAASLTVF